MANGRFLSKTISVSVQLARVSDLAELLFYRMVPHQDRDGRLEGDPLLIKAACAPLKTCLTIEKIPELLYELTQATDADGEPLIRWYQVKGRQVVQFPGFTRHQPGLRREREAESRLPAFDGDAVPLTPPNLRLPPKPQQRSRPAPRSGGTTTGSGPEPDRMQSGSTPELVPQKLSEVQGQVEVQDKDKSAAGAASRSPYGDWVPEFVTTYSDHLGTPPRLAQRVGMALKPLLPTFGLPRLHEMWDAYCRMNPHMGRDGQADPKINQPQFCSPEGFASSARFWFDYTEPLKVGPSNGAHS